MSSVRALTPSGRMKPNPTCRPTAATLTSGPGTRFFNVYPLWHTAALYDGFRRDVNHRARPGAGCLPGRTAQCHNLLVIGYLPHLGHAEAPDSRWAQLYCFRSALLV